jgi:hypothetical protein
MYFGSFSISTFLNLEVHPLPQHGRRRSHPLSRAWPPLLPPPVGGATPFPCCTAGYRRGRLTPALHLDRLRPTAPLPIWWSSHLLQLVFPILNYFVNWILKFTNGKMCSLDIGMKAAGGDLSGMLLPVTSQTPRIYLFAALVTSTPPLPLPLLPNELCSLLS